MVKKLLIFIFICVMSCAAPMQLKASESDRIALEQIEEPCVNVIVNQSKLIVSGAVGEVLEIVSLTGNPIAKIKIENPTQRIDLNLPKGCYILKVGKVVRKFAVR
ncbi:MAG: T9SS type A sorting domain-containing protein [Prevotella sp.]